MFICAFSRGIRFGWLKDPSHAYRAAAEKAWNGIENCSVDRFGNVHGVCRGSEFSFNPNYYAEHLLPNLNDNHGVGIVMLAGVELLTLRLAEDDGAPFKKTLPRAEVSAQSSAGKV